MKVTAITRQLRRGTRYSVFIDGRYTCSLGEATLLESKLTVGQEVSEQRLRELKGLAASDKAYTDALHYVTIRMRSEWEITTYLHRKQVEMHRAQEVKDRLATLGFIDDLAFARNWVASRRLLRTMSRRRLRQELQQKHVDQQIIREVMQEDAESSDEMTVLRELIARKRRLSRYQQDERKLLQYLARQGYEYDLIQSALAEEGDGLS